MCSGKKIVFIIGSTINPNPNKGLNYTNTRSIFSIEDRIKQTADSIKSIRKFVPNSLIIVSDNSKTLPMETFKLLVDAGVDIILTHYKEETTDSIYKARGEASCIMNGLRYLEEYSIDYDLLFKLSGRYSLTEKFGLTNFQNDNKISCWIHPSNHAICTVLYSIPKKCIEKYTKAIELVLTKESHNSIEEQLRTLLKDYLLGISSLGASGLVSVDGSHWEL